MTRDDKINVALIIAVVVWAAIAYPAAWREYADAGKYRGVVERLPQ